MMPLLRSGIAKEYTVMNRFNRTVIIFLSISSASVALAVPGHSREFVGVWQGVDPEDGSLQTVTITETEQRKVRVLVHDTWFTLCGGDRGLGQGLGVWITPRILDVQDYVLTCQNGETKAGPTRFILGRQGAMQRNLAPPSPAITYYRISR